MDVTAHGPGPALALGGGGLRGMAHLGVLAALEEAGRPPAAIAGTSVGALVAALWGYGHSAAALQRLALRARLHDVFDPVPLWRLVGSMAGARLRRGPGAGRIDEPPVGLYRGDRLGRLVDALSGGARVGDLPRPVALVAADLYERRAVVFTPRRWRLALAAALPEAHVDSDAPLAVAVRASTAIPGVFPPVAWDGRLLGDGALVHPVPVLAARALGPHPTWAVAVPNPPFPVLTALEVVEAALACMACQLEQYELAAADAVIRPQVPGARLTDLALVPRLIRAGREAARSVLARLEPAEAG